MLGKICPSGSPVGWDGQWGILLLGIEACGTRCCGLCTNTAHLLQLWAGAALEGTKVLLALGCWECNPAFLVRGKGAREPG